VLVLLLTTTPRLVRVHRDESISGNNANISYNKAEGGAAEKRDVDEAAAPRRRARVTTMYVRRGVPACEYRQFPLHVARYPSDAPCHVIIQHVTY